MSAAHFPDIVAFIEGSMERIFINDNFKYIRVVTLRNGSSWSIDAMCNQIVSNFRLIAYEPDFIVVWFDREDSLIDSATISQKITESLAAEGIQSSRLSVCIPDKMTENVILADEEVIRNEFGAPDYIYGGDGSNGKSIISKMYREIGINYKETYHGAKLLKKVRLSRSAQLSEVSAHFLEGLTPDCWWK